MKLGGVLDFAFQGQVWNDKNTVPGKVLRVESAQSNLYTVQLGSQDLEITVKYDGEPLKPGDSLKIPVSLFTQIQTQAPIASSDSASISSSLVDQLFQIIAGGGFVSQDEGGLTKDDRSVQLLMNIVKNLPETEQKKILEHLIKTIADSGVKNNPPIKTVINNPQISFAGSETISPRVNFSVQTFVENLLNELPRIMSESSDGDKNRILSNISSLLLPILEGQQSSKGIIPLNQIATESTPVSKNIGSELLKIISPELQRGTEFSVLHEKSYVQFDKTSIPFEVKTSLVESLQPAQTQGVKDMQSSLVNKLLLPVVEQLKQDSSLFLIRYEPEKNEQAPVDRNFLEKSSASTFIRINPNVLSAERNNPPKSLPETGSLVAPMPFHDDNLPTGKSLYEKIVTLKQVPEEIKRMVQIRFPNVADIIKEISISSEKTISQIVPSESFELMESKLATLSPDEKETPFVRAVISHAMNLLLESGDTSLFQRVVSQLEPVAKTVSTIDSVVKSLLQFTSTEEKPLILPKKVVAAAKGVESSLQTVMNQFETHSIKGNNEMSVKANILNKLGDSWGMFFESRLLDSMNKNAVQEPEVGLKQKLQVLSKEITQALVSQTLQSTDETEGSPQRLLKHVGKDVIEVLSKIEGSQGLSQPQESGKEREQILWMPVYVGGEWTRLGVEFRREHRGKGGRGKLGNRVNIHMELKKMGRVTAELDLDANKQLRVTLGATKEEANNWFKEHEQEIYNSLEHSKLKSVILSIQAVMDKDSTVDKRDSFQVSG